VCAVEQEKERSPSVKHGPLEFCDLTTHNAQGQSSGSRGLVGVVAGGSKWRMHLKALITFRHFYVSCKYIVLLANFMFLHDWIYNSI